MDRRSSNLAIRRRFGQAMLVAVAASATAAHGEGRVIASWAVVTPSADAADYAGPARITVDEAPDLAGAPIDFSRARQLVGDPAPVVPFIRGAAALMPVGQRAVTSGFGMRLHPLLGGTRMHAGVDFAAPSGSPVLATSDGVVGQAGRAGGYGLLVGIRGAAGLETRYAHLSRLNVAPGQTVRRGQVLGWSGSTGLSTGPHLHYEVRVNGRAVNPLGH
jgi:murein DD-endopeptidase MepM/ murein hydrolase activator NlpD